MSTEDWKVQVSYKTPAGDLINIRANSTEELSVLLEGVGDYATQISSTRRIIDLQYDIAPLSTTSSTASTAPSGFSAPAQVSTPSDTLTTPTCVHGQRKFLSGISKKNGKPYKMWVCPQPQGADQCTPVNG